jgi:hypothetical protein
MCDMKKQKGQLLSFLALVESLKVLFKGQTLKHPKLAQLDKSWFKWFTAIHFEGRPVTGHMIIEKAEFL